MNSVDVIVVGAGVIGLTTGVCLAEQGLRVRLYAREAPAATTSAVASAMVGPGPTPFDDPTGERARVAVLEFTALAAVEGSGVAIRRGRMARRAMGPAPLPGLPACAPDELPAGFAAGFWARLPLVEMNVYLGYLTGRLHAAGGEIVPKDVASIGELAGSASLLVNCTGVGARELVPDPAVRPVRGQHVVVDNPGLDEFFVESPDGPTWTAYFPYSDHVVLGGVAGDGDENPDPDPRVAQEILRRCVAVEPRLAGARVLAHQVGFRPARPTIRLEAEEFHGSRCVHHYGHGGSGVALSWGTAREAAALLTGR